MKRVGRVFLSRQLVEQLSGNEGLYFGAGHTVLSSEEWRNLYPMISDRIEYSIIEQIDANKIKSVILSRGSYKQDKSFQEPSQVLGNGIFEIYINLGE